MRSGSLRLHGIDLSTPVFFPDATQGVVRAVDAQDLLNCHIQAVMMNTFHLMQHPGSLAIRSLGGLHKMAGWPGLIMTDSGGFQAYSLIHQNPKFGTISDQGINFLPEGSNRKYQLTPEKCIQLQIGYGSDVIISLDDCTHVDAPLAEQQISVKRTIAWAKRCKKEYQHQLEVYKLDDEHRPLLFAVVQGGASLELRKTCAEALLEIGFDGYGYGGWPLDAEGHLLTDLIAYTRELIPLEFPIHALGIGHPYNLLASYKLGYDLFDSTMPTRDARHGRLYTFTQPLPSGTLLTQEQMDHFFSGSWLDYIYIGDDIHIRADHPIAEDCDCPTCSHFSLGYLHHLFKINDTLFYRLATLHNLRFMTRLTEILHSAAYE